ncbi:putative bifunctional diguanylate cyclase/phosphodiesterase [Marinobacter fonticola]|uniref:putative bifunctional diguanylate cyclase/phosphodiesterase n=1 Tax=Marinobacter fonticola TaxID=2603215 RepID=UPI0011E676DB|nr:EAL domain-containing protein [Marinobacter fonticola]
MARLFVSVGHTGNERIFRDVLPDYALDFSKSGRLPETPFDIAVLDLNAFSRLRQDLSALRRLNAPIVLPVLLILRESQMAQVRHLLGSEVDEVLLKPLSSANLAARVDNLVRARALSEKQQTELDSARQDRLRTHRAYKVLAACNETVLRGDTEGQLIGAVLQNVIELSDYNLAWVGVARHDEQHSIEVLAHAGHLEPFMKQLIVRWQDDAYSYGPSGRAIKEQRAIVCQNVETDPDYAPWREAAQAHGIAATLALPMAFDAGENGVLAIYSALPNAFNADEIMLLERLAANLSYGVSALRTRTDLKEQRSLAWDRAYRDALTHLPNRHWVMEELNKLDIEVARHKRYAAVLFIDLDGFKRINDSLGHEVGDRLLHRVAERLRSIAREEDFVARLGGDEFLILMRFDPSDDAIAAAEVPRDAVAEAAAQLARRLVDGLSQSFEDAEMEHHLGSSIGISLYPDDTDQARSLVNCADIAMYEAKSAGGGDFRFYYNDLSVRQRDKLTLKNDLYKAVNDRAFTAYFQPIVNIETGQTEYVEALMRLNRPDGTVVSPMEFLQTLEETGLIARTGQLMLDEAGHTLAHCREIEPDLCLALNLSVNQLWQADLVEQLEHMLEKYKLPPAALMLELTEGSMISDVRKMEAFLQQLHAQGYEIAIDDFGTGYSSLSRLRALPVSKLKLDKSFLTQVPQNRESLDMVKAVLQMSNSLNITMVAEGIETEEQLEALRQLRCPLGQGYLFARPMPAAELLNYLLANKKQNTI